MAFVTKNRAHLAPWEPTREPEYFTLEHWEAALERSEESAARGTHLARFVMSEGRVIGTVNLSNIVRGVFQSAHLGYSIDAEWEGRGAMREAVEAVVDHAFAEDGLHLHRVEANYQPHNERSGALLARLGFERVGLSRSYLFLDGAWRDHVITARIHPNG